MDVCLFVNFYSVRDFSGTAWTRISKLGTHIGYDKLSCVINHIMLISPFIAVFVHFSFSVTKTLLLLILAQVFKFVRTLRVAKYIMQNN